MTLANFPGQVTLVGAGPGDPDLLTCKALKTLQTASIVVHDKLVSGPILDLIPKATPRIDVGKSPDHHPVPQEEINELLVRLSHKFPHVVRLKGGDPYMFARGSEEIAELRLAGVPVSVVPGISAAQGVAAATGAPLTHRGLATGVRFVTGHCRAGHSLDLDWRGLADADTTLVFYMGRGHAYQIAGALMAHGLAPSTPAMLVANGTRPNQLNRFCDLAELGATADKMPKAAPVLMMIGKVVALATQFGEGEARVAVPLLDRVSHA